MNLDVMKLDIPLKTYKLLLFFCALYNIIGNKRVTEESGMDNADFIYNRLSHSFAHTFFLFPNCKMMMSDKKTNTLTTYCNSTKF